MTTRVSLADLIENQLSLVVVGIFNIALIGWSIALTQTKCGENLASNRNHTIRYAVIA